MKNQYFGDINDYLKYGLLRTISQSTELRLAVCWMLTPDDGGADGNKTGYLERPTKWRQYDPQLFDTLRESIENGRRSIEVVETGGLLPGVVYHSDVLNDNKESRSQYFDRLELQAATCDLVFLDPDNGMAVKSKPKGRKGSSKYLYWDEINRIGAKGKSQIVFQHFAMEKRDAFIAERQQRLRMETGANWVGVLTTAHVAYFIVPTPAHEQAMREAHHMVCRQWAPCIKNAEIAVISEGYK